ncbi:DUF2059 domain-containing protein [Chelativorans intermedius]|uniref:DUF2059 domain-containing protein n=1 Tax=Chelativorans intermedius TaxID=515947 RepID=A0ABV6DAK2_9HYPH|nr:DUF2059 domain-containing protein [Chelativorans intermedius]MCT9000086.1 DUF2059 domain-containing protein [Chelativorans intermedius]
MKLARCARLVALTAAMALTAFSMRATAQEISDSHLKAAYAAIDAIAATNDFDAILPQAAQRLKAELIQQSPNMVELINATVDQKALELASRRADLEREAALAYARVFSEEDLSAITEFYTSPAGKKLLSDGPIVTREVLQAAEIWQRGLVRDLANAVGEQLQAASGAQAPAEGETGAEPGAGQ